MGGRGWTRTIDPLVNTNRSLLSYPSAVSRHLCKSIDADPGGFEPPVNGFGDRHATAAPRARIMTIFTDCHYQHFYSHLIFLSKMTTFPRPGKE